MDDDDVKQIPPAHREPDHPLAKRSSHRKHSYRLNEPAMPQRDAAASQQEKQAALKRIADWLDVEQSARYERTPELTYCNVYATDYCYLAGVYLPRVWWNEATLKPTTGRKPVFDQAALREMQADDLYQWLQQYGTRYGWRQVHDADALQAAANQGGIGIICADRRERGRSGHITVVVPEHDAHAAERDKDGKVVQPLQSQAGAKNYRYGSAGKQWWQVGDTFVGFVFFVHD